MEYFMRMHGNWLLACAGVLVLGIGSFLFIRSIGAADDDSALRNGVIEMGKLIERRDLEGAKRKASDLAKKSEVMDFMTFFKKRDSGGFGIGDTAGAIDPDSIDLKLTDLAKKGARADELAKHAADFAKMALQTAAIAQITEALAPAKKEPGKDPADWKKWADATRDDALKLREIAKAPKVDTDSFKKTVTKLAKDCKQCHDVFREMD
jgi:hypothetical protein